MPLLMLGNTASREKEPMKHEQVIQVMNDPGAGITAHEYPGTAGAHRLGWPPPRYPHRLSVDGVAPLVIGTAANSPKMNVTSDPKVALTLMHRLPHILLVRGSARSRIVDLGGTDIRRAAKARAPIGAVGGVRAGGVPQAKQQGLLPS